MPEQSPTLRDMIQEAASSGQTYEQLAQRAKRRGAKTSGSYLNNIVLGNVSRLPTPENLRGIAWALDVSYERVRQAAIAQWLPPEEGATGSTAADIPPERRALLIAALEQLQDGTAEVERLLKAGNIDEQGGAA